MSIIEAARLAPSANNSQIWRFFIVRDPDLLRQVCALTHKPSLSDARTIIAACAQPWIVQNRGKQQPFFMIDIPIALVHIVLMAQESGVAARLAFDFDEERLISLIDAPKGYRAVALVALGYADDVGVRRKGGGKDIVRVL